MLQVLLGRWSFLAGVAAALLLAGIAADRFTPWIGTNARIQHFKAEAAKWRKGYDDWKAYGEAERDAFRTSERYRQAENERAIKDLNDAMKRCDARVERARKSSTAIRSLITQEPKRDPANACPLRGLIDSDGLRLALIPES